MKLSYFNHQGKKMRPGIGHAVDPRADHRRHHNLLLEVWKERRKERRGNSKNGLMYWSGRHSGFRAARFFEALRIAVV